MGQKIKSFNEHLFNVECSELLKKVKEVRIYNDALSEFEGMKNLEQINEYLQEKTKWTNHLMSASTMGLEKEYEIIQTLEGKINIDDYTPDLTDLTPECKTRIKEKHIKYWTEAEVKQISEAEAAIEKVNKLPIGIRAAISTNRSNQFIFNSTYWNNYTRTLK